MRLLVALLLSTLLVSCKEQQKSNDALNKNQTQDSLTLSLQSFEKENTLPGFGVSIFTKDSILYQKGFGYANITKKQKYSIDHVQIIASVTKTLVGLSLMNAVEDNLLALDDDINQYLPFEVINPNFPEDTITLRMLASHTSSISGTKKSDKGYRFESPLLAPDFPEAYQELLVVYNQTEALDIPTFLQRKLTKEGIWYDPEIFTSEKPGTTYNYSNLGITLLAYILELQTGKPFNEYTQETILEPLSLSRTTWNLESIPKQDQVTYYNELYNEVPSYSIISYPDGGLYSSVADLTAYLQEVMKGYEGESKLFTKRAIQELSRKQFEGEDLTEGLCWDLSFTGLIGHSGNDFGTATLMYFSPETGIGRILFTNISIETEAQEESFYGIFNTLFEYSFF